MNKIFYGAAGLAAAASLSGCHKCEGEAPRFTAEQMQYLPEDPPGQKVLFRSSNADTLYYRQQRTITYPKTRVSKGGSKTCPDEQITEATLEMSRKNLPAHGYAAYFLMALDKRTNGFEQRVAFNVPQGYGYNFSGFPQHLDQVKLGPTVHQNVELFDATSYNDSVQYGSAWRLHRLYFKKGTGVIGYELVQATDTMRWWREQ